MKIAISAVALLVSNALFAIEPPRPVNDELTPPVQEKTQKTTSAHSTAQAKAAADSLTTGMFYAKELIDAGFSRDNIAAWTLESQITANEAFATAGVNYRIRTAWLREWDLSSLTGLSNGSIVSALGAQHATLRSTLMQGHGVSQIGIWSPGGTDASCGNGYTNNPSRYTDGTAYNYTAQRFATNCDSSGWAHELGHNLGMAHNKEVTPTNTYHPHGHGTSCADKGTIMAYVWPHHSFYSTPEITINGEVCGDATNADNTRVLREVGDDFATMNGQAALPSLSVLINSTTADYRQEDNGTDITVTVRRTNSMGEAWAAVRLNYGAATAADAALATYQGKTMSSHEITAPVDDEYEFAVAHFADGQAEATVQIEVGSDTAEEGEEEFVVEVVAGISVNWESANAPKVTLFDYDRTPEAFSFPAVTGVEKATAITSAVATINGIDNGTTISVQNGSYSVGCTGSFTTAAGTINNGDTVCLQHTSASVQTTDVVTSLTIGHGLATFKSTTKADATTGGGSNEGSTGGGGGGGSTGLLTVLMGALAIAARRKSAAK